MVHNSQSISKTETEKNFALSFTKTNSKDRIENHHFSYFNLYIIYIPDIHSKPYYIHRYHCKKDLQGTPENSCNSLQSKESCNLIKYCHKTTNNYLGRMS